MLKAQKQLWKQKLVILITGAVAQMWARAYKAIHNKAKKYI